MIVFHNAGKSFGNTVALQPADLEIASNKTTVLIGLSGSGKSTILRLISGLLEPTTGWIEIDGEKLTRDNLPDLRRRMGYVFQSGDLFPHLTARQNILLVAQELRVGMDEMTARIAELCGLARLPAALLDRYPVELSGGEQRRVSLIRALMLKPDILLLDEPMGALDPMVRAGLLTDLKSLFDRLNTTVVLVTHDLLEAARLGDWVVLLNAGKIVQQGAYAELSMCPAEPFVSEFFHAQMEDIHS
ncbi:MAG TPA: ATP-binding cassette domain-containing protein [Candidatus Sulfotelmatobacter sp.]|nr:ATP-binding cassette domain-containing protein [Candidatus Sulfotelmatobacter sp.]